MLTFHCHRLLTLCIIAQDSTPKVKAQKMPKSGKIICCNFFRKNLLTKCWDWWYNGISGPPARSGGRQLLYTLWGFCQWALCINPKNWEATLNSDWPMNPASFQFHNPHWFLPSVCLHEIKFQWQGSGEIRLLLTDFFLLSGDMPRIDSCRSAIPYTHSDLPMPITMPRREGGCKYNVITSHLLQC